jgi:chromosome segregation ATPase
MFFFVHRSRTNRYDEVNKLIQEKLKKRNELQDQRKSKWRELEGFQEQIQEVRQELERGKQQLNSTIPRYNMLIFA